MIQKETQIADLQHKLLEKLHKSQTENKENLQKLIETQLTMINKETKIAELTQQITKILELTRRMEELKQPQDIEKYKKLQEDLTQVRITINKHECAISSGLGIYLIYEYLIFFVKWTDTVIQ